MSTPTHQTIKLSKGKHSSPDSGACVMELASMLAGEPFTDHPHTVCPVIGSFLRAYNDAIDDGRRQDLYAYAASVVGSRASGAAERARAERLTTWAAEMRARHWTRALIPNHLQSIGWRRAPSVDAVGTRAVHSIRKHTDETHSQVLTLIDELLVITSPAPRANSRPKTVFDGLTAGV